MEACKTSQFEQHLRAVCRLPLGSTALITPVVMVNLLGEHIAPLMDYMRTNRMETAKVVPKLHLYGKKDIKPKRKMGHINLLVDDVQDALDWVKQAGIW